MNSPERLCEPLARLLPVTPLLPTSSKDATPGFLHGPRVILGWRTDKELPPTRQDNGLNPFRTISSILCGPSPPLPRLVLTPDELLPAHDQFVHYVCSLALGISRCYTERLEDIFVTTLDSME